MSHRTFDETIRIFRNRLHIMVWVPMGKELPSYPCSGTSLSKAPDGAMIVGLVYFTYQYEYWIGLRTGFCWNFCHGFWNCISCIIFHLSIGDWSIPSVLSNKLIVGLFWESIIFGWLVDIWFSKLPKRPRSKWCSSNSNSNLFQVRFY